jgi:hypothetical protein
MSTRIASKLVIIEKKISILAKFNNNSIKIDKQLYLTLVRTINNLVTIDTTHVAMLDSTILNFSHVRHAT